MNREVQPIANRLAPYDCRQGLTANRNQDARISRTFQLLPSDPAVTAELGAALLQGVDTGTTTLCPGMAAQSSPRDEMSLRSLEMAMENSGEK